MKLVLYVFVFSQIFNLLNVLAEKIKNEQSEQKIKWERVRDEKSNNLKKIIWKSYNDDDSYFENINKENKLDEILSNTKNEKNKFINQKKKQTRITRTPTTCTFK